MFPARFPWDGSGAGAGRERGGSGTGAERERDGSGTGADTERKITKKVPKMEGVGFGFGGRIACP